MAQKKFVALAGQINNTPENEIYEVWERMKNAEFIKMENSVYNIAKLGRYCCADNLKYHDRIEVFYLITTDNEVFVLPSCLNLWSEQILRWVITRGGNDIIGMFPRRFRFNYNRETDIVQIDMIATGDMYNAKSEG